MALTSFTLRKTSSGSYLQQNGNTDSSIRADGLSVENAIASFTTGTNTFSANIIGQGVVRLEWTLEDALVSTVTSGVQPVELRIISSYTGEPVTIRDGIFVQSITATTPTSYFDDVPVIQEGRWVYYSLFAKYSNGTDYWFIRVATLYIQIPINYGSVEALWQHIPEYYKTLDYAQPDLTNGYTPLYAFLELFGNEVDRTRTLIESVALSNDPELAVTPALQQLAYEVGLEITTDDLGTSKVRSLLSNIGTLRQQKGTISNICSYISAMSGCPVTYTYNSALPKPHVFTVYAQRVNFISDPEFRNATVTTSSGTVTQNGTTYYAKLQTTSTWGVYTYGTNTMGASNPIIVNGTTTGITLTMPANSYDTRTVMIYPRKPFPYLGTNTYGNSYNYTGTTGASFSAIRTATDTTRLAWESGITSASMPVTLFADDAWYSETKYSYNSTSTRPSLEYIAPSSTRTNFVKNSSFEIDASGWGGSGTAVTTVARSTAKSFSGTASLVATATAVGNIRAYYSGLTNNTVGTSTTRIPVVAGATYTASAYTLAATTPRITDVIIEFYDASSVLISSPETADVLNSTTSWTKTPVLTTTAPTNAVTAVMSIRMQSAVIGEVHYIDGVLFEQTSSSLPYFEGTTLGASSTVSSVPVLVFQMSPGSSISISDWLFEPATNGDYFSGNTREGGYIPIQTGTSGGGTFDYYWDTAGGGANNGYSYYLLDHERTIKTTERVIAQYVAPVTMLDKYSLTWDYYPGK